MTRARAWAGLVSLLWLLAATSATSRAAEPPMPVVEYVERLDALISALGTGTPAQAARLVETLPLVLRVDGSPLVFEVRTDSMRRDFRAWQTDGNEARRAHLLKHLQTLRSEAVRFQEPAATSSRQRGLLTDILSGKEFENVHGPTWIDRLRQRALVLLAALLGRLIQASAIPTISSILVYGLIALAVIVVALATYRFLRNSAAAETILPSPTTASVMDWPRWLAEAQAAAAGGNWREAIHFTYWCAVAFLEAKGAWRPDRARTPREYLRLLPPSSDDGAPLAALTRRFELVWYGNAAADAEAFAEAVANLKNMGCPSV